MTESELTRCYRTQTLYVHGPTGGTQEVDIRYLGDYTRANSDNLSALILSGMGFRHWLNED